jgi:hypothetical protein
MLHLKRRRAGQGTEGENRFPLAIKSREDYQAMEVLVSDLALDKKPEADLSNNQWSAKQHWDLQVNKLMGENFVNVSALPPDLLEKYIVAQAGKFSRECYAHQPAMTPLIIFPQNLLPLGIKLKLLNARARSVPNRLLPTPIDFTRFGSRIGEPVSSPYLIAGLEIKKNKGLASKITPLFLYSMNGKKEMTLDEGLMLVYFYGLKFKIILKGTIYFSENREKYWPILEFSPDSGSYELRLSNFKDHESDAFVPFSHKRFY